MSDLNEIENLLKGLEIDLDADYKRISEEIKPYEEMDALLESLSKNQPHVPTKSSYQQAKEFGNLPPQSYTQNNNNNNTNSPVSKPAVAQTASPLNQPAKATPITSSNLIQAVPLNSQPMKPTTSSSVIQAVPLNARMTSSQPQSSPAASPTIGTPPTVNGITFAQPQNRRPSVVGRGPSRVDMQKDLVYKSPLPNANLGSGSVSYPNSNQQNSRSTSSFISNKSVVKPVFDTQKVTVQILQGAEFQVHNPLLHCVCSIPNTEFEFRTRSAGSIPANWNERFNFLPIPVGEKAYSILKFEVFNNLTESLGSIDISLATLQRDKAYKVWLKLKNVPAGKVLVNIVTTKILCREPTLANHVIQEIITQCKQKGGKFVDPEFTTSLESIYKNPANHSDEVIMWKRPSEIAPNPELYVEGIESGDVIQGDLGDCYFLGAVSVIATRNDLLEPLFVSAHPEYGVYQVKFYKNGRWQLITIDDQIPVRASDLRPLYARCKDRNEMWVPLIEKAYAKLHGCYEALEGGNLGAALTDLTGEFTQIYNFDEVEVQQMMKSGRLWEEMKWFQSEDYLMGCSYQNPGLNEVDNGLGLLYNHAYGLLSLQDPVGAVPEPLICLRNPWGHLEWTGRWADNSKEWTPEIMKQLNFTFEDDGTFYMCLQDFLAQYNNLIVLRLLQDEYGKVWQRHVFESRWGPETSGGCMNYNSWSVNPQYYIRATKPNTKIFVSLSQPDVRLDWKTEFSVDIGMYLLTHNSSKAKKKAVQPSDIVARTHFITAREISFDSEITTGQEYVLVPATYEPRKEMNFWLTVFSEEPIIMEEIIPPTQQTKSIAGAWSFQNSGGCVNFPTWTKNPIFLITPTAAVNQTVTVSVVLRQGSGKLCYIGMYLGKWTGAQVDRYSISKMVNCVNSVEVTCDLELSAADFPLFVMPNTFDPGEQNTFELTVSSTIDIDLRSVQ